MAASNLAEGMGHPQLAKFLRQHIVEDDVLVSRLPKFYGIPKIHKNPVKMRPIIPCHSALQNPAAKYVSKVLKAVLANRPYVLKGTKDLAIRLTQAKISSTRKKFLVSFDIEAFYPNIPLDDAIEQTKQMWWDEIKPGLTEKALFNMCISLACKNLLCQFDRKVFLQLQGIAMGVACSPDIANIHAAYYEEIFIERIAMEQEVDDFLAFYGRFIDDGFMIVYAKSEQDALQKCKTWVQFIGHKLTWEVSEWNLPFLDMLVYVDPVTGKIEHKPFRKARNHLERIPFASHHPFDVRKGTFLGEMSRMAVLSSNPANYKAALNDLQSIYIARGYPVDLVRKWTKDNIAKRWTRRLEETPNDDGVVSAKGVQTSNLLVLKTTFNPIWDSFNVHDLSKIVVDKWISGLPKGTSEITRLMDFGASKKGDETVLTVKKAEAFAKFYGFDPASGEVVNDMEDILEEEQQPEGASLPPTVASQGNIPSVASPSRLGAWEDISFETTRRVNFSSNSLEIVRRVDVRKIGLTTARWLVSRKRSRNFADRLSRTKKAVLDNIEDDLDSLVGVNGDEPSPVFDDDVAMYDAFEHYLTQNEL